jgi:hypothetical protein
MKSRIFRTLSGVVALVALLAIAGPALAVHPEERSEVENLRKRIEALEAEKEKPEAPLILEALSKKLRLTGLLELEASYARTEGADEAGDLAVATAQIGLEATLNHHISGHIILLHEEGEDQSVVVDEAVITLGCASSFCPGDFSLAGGKMYLPFGKFNSHFLSDPLTLELGETNNTALYVGWAVAERVDLKLGVFSGETDTAGDNDTIDSWVASLEGSPFEGLTLGASYISDLAESDIGLVADEESYSSSVDGASAYISATFGSFTLEAEYLTALKSFDNAVLAAGAADPDYEGGLTGKKPSAWNVELALAPNERWEVAVKAEGADDFQDDLNRYGAVLSYGLFQNTVVGLEYLLADQKSGDEDRSHTVTAQLAFEF